MTFPQQTWRRPHAWMQDDPEEILPASGDPTTPPHLGALAVAGQTAVSPTGDAAAPPHPHTLDCSVSDFVLRCLRSAEEDGRLAEEQTVRVVLNNFLMWRGAHDQYASADGTIAQLLADDEDAGQVFNWYAQQIEGKAKEWAASRPRVEVTGRTRDYRLAAAAPLAEALDRYVRQGQITAHLLQSEAKFGLLAKFYYRFSELVADEADERATRVRVPVTEERDFHLGALFFCPRCDDYYSEPDNLEGTPAVPAETAAAPAGDTAPAAACPECGHEETEVADPRFAFRREVETGGVREHVVPRLRWHSPNPLNVKCDSRARTFSESWYVIYDTLERRFELEGRHPDEDLKTVPAAGGDLLVRQRASLALETSTSGMASPIFEEVPHAEERSHELVRRRRFWMLPVAYRHMRARADENFCGIEIEAGHTLGEYFPAGLFADVSGDRHVTAGRSESKNKRWSGAPFTLDPTTLKGKGSEDANGIQETIDDMATLAVSHFDREGAPKEIIDTRLVDIDEFDGATGKRIPMKESAPTDENLKASDAIHVVQSGQLGSDFIAFFTALPNVMRETGGVANPIVGLEDEHNPTARGRELAAQQASSTLIPSLELRAEMVEEETTYQNLEYCQAEWSDEDFALFESEFGQEAIDTFRQLNVRRDLDAAAARGSWIPETRETELAHLEEFSTKYLPLMAAGPDALAVVKYAAAQLNIPKSAFLPLSDEKIAQSRLALLRHYAERAYKAGATELSPEAYQQGLGWVFMSDRKLQPRPFENHAVQASFLVEQWKNLFDDRQANPILMDLIEQLIGLHMGFVAETMAAPGEEEEETKERDFEREQKGKDADTDRQVKIERAKGQSRKKPAGKK